MVNEMNTLFKAKWRMLVGTAFLWVALAAMMYVPASGSDMRGVIVAGLGFLFFAAGLMLFASGLKRDIVAQLLRERLD